MNNHQRTYVVAALLCTWLFAASASACRIPVFRYALERWSPGVFELVILHTDETTEQQTELIQSLTTRTNDRDNPINLRINVVDLSSDSISDADQVLLRATGIDPADVTSPRAVLLFPRFRGQTTIAWQGDFTPDEMSRLLDSPARQQTLEGLLSGDSAVWVLIEGPDAEANDAAAALLETELARVEELIDLPDQEVLEAEAEFKADTTVELRIGFSLLRLKRDDPQEAAFLEMLLNTESDLSTFEEPIAIPIFGRGRTYYALVGKGIQPDLIEENCRFICGDCSCQVKEENPGSDLLFAANWDDGIRGSAFPEQVLPELTGIGSLDVIDLADYERQAQQDDGGSKAEPDDDAVSVVETAVGSTGAIASSEFADADSATETAAIPSATVDEVSPLWMSLLPVVGLAFIIGIVGMLLLRS